MKFRSLLMNKKEGVYGFTLVELLIVLVIVGIFALIAMPQYQKTTESSYADQAVSVLQIIGTTNRLYYLDKGSYAAGYLNSCPAGVLCGSGSPSACDLMNCQYMAMQNFSQGQYNFCATNGIISGIDPCGLASSAGNFVACAIRRNCTNTSPCGSGGGSDPNSDVTTRCTTNSSYKTWGYTVDVNGTVRAWGTPTAAPAPPS